MKKLKFADRWRRLKKADVQRCMDRLPPELIDAFVLKPDVWKGCIAGGFIRSVLSEQPVNDIDVFLDVGVGMPKCPKCGTNCYDPQTTALAADDHEQQYALSLTCFTPAVQIIQKSVYRGSSPTTTIDKFDVTVNQAAIWYDSSRKQWTGTCADRFYRDLQKRSITVCNPWVFPVNRIGKFLRLGYTVPERIIAAAVGASLSGDDTEIVW